MTDSTNQLHLARFVLGDFQTNCFVLHVEGSSDCWIIDAGERPTELLAYISDNNLEPTAIILTHAHGDHIASLQQLHDRWPDVPIYLNPEEDEFLKDPSLNLSAFIGTPFTVPSATHQLRHGDTLTLAGIDFECRHVPGHSPGSTCLYQKETGLLIAGDTLFNGGIGRTDFPRSDHATLLKSINEQILTLPDETQVYPGHGEPTTVGQERVSNPFLH